MKQLFLEILAEITNQRDSLSLQRSLLSALADNLPFKTIYLYRLSGDSISSGLEQILKISVDENCMNSTQIICDEVIALEAITRASVKLIESSVEKSSPAIDDESDDSVSMSIPIIINQKVMSVLFAVADKEIKQEMDQISSIVSIYANFLEVLIDSEQDKLTGLFNRRTFDAKLNRMLTIQRENKNEYLSKQNKNEQRSISADSCAWLVALDIDFFKRVNDEYGHVVGDEVLLRLSQKMKQCFRNTDLLFRFGGEEFVIILEPISYEMARAALNRFRKIISDHQFPLAGTITVSIGFAGITSKDFPVTVLDYADKALYYAKEHGRNCVYNYEELVSKGELAKMSVEGSIDLF